MHDGEHDIKPENLADAFANKFEQKINSIQSSTTIDENVYNGTKKMTPENENFVTELEIMEAISLIKQKNCEGIDRIPQRILVDGIPILIKPLTKLFNSIYNNCDIPDQWRMAKVVPVFKKGDSKNISNYRPINARAVHATISV